MTESQLVTLALYTFSSLLQADAAIFGLMAVFLVYRLQTLEGDLHTAYDVLFSGSTGGYRPRKLVRPMSLAERHGLLMSYRHSPERYHMETLLFTADWRRVAIRSSVYSFAALLVHAAIAAGGLYYSYHPESLLGLSPQARIADSLFLFVVLLTYVAASGIRSIYTVSTRPIAPIPSISLIKLRVNQLVAFFPNDTESPNIYCDNGDLTHLFVFRRRNEKNVHIATYTVDASGQWTVVLDIDNLTVDSLKQRLDEFKENPRLLWTKSAQ